MRPRAGIQASAGLLVCQQRRHYVPEFKAVGPESATCRTHGARGGPDDTQHCYLMDSPLPNLTTKGVASSDLLFTFPEGVLPHSYGGGGRPMLGQSLKPRVVTGA